MTRVDFKEWVLAHGCEIVLLKSTNRTGNAVKVVNKKTNEHIFMELPMDEKPVKHFTVCTGCAKLGIPIPNECNYMQELDELIRRNHSI